MPISTCFKTVLFSVMKIHIIQLQWIIALTNCTQCLNAAIPLDETHDCWRVRNRSVRFEKHHLIYYFMAARESLFNLLLRQPLIQDIKDLLYIHLYAHNYSTQEIHNYITEQRIIDVAISYEASSRIFENLWENHPENATVTNSAASTSTTCTEATTTSTATPTSTATVTSTATSSGGPIDLTGHSPDN